MRFFVTSDCIGEQEITLLPEDANHVFRVLRMHPGEEISVCADNGKKYECLLIQVDKSGVTAQIQSVGDYSNEPSAHVTVYAALAKGDRFDYLIQKCVECGVSRIVPFLSERCVARPVKNEYDKKRQRFQRIALEASKQSQRSRPVEVGEILDFATAMTQAAQADTALLLYEKENRVSLSGALKNSDPCGTFSVVTGPEGGFSEEEAKQAMEQGLQSVSIGPRILRCETAPVAALCAIMYQTGNFDIGEWND